MTTPTDASRRHRSCAVVGCGGLGKSFCKQLLSLSEFESWTITGITKTSDNHESIQQDIGHSDRFQVKTWDDCPKNKSFDTIIFCAPPHGFKDFPKAMEEAATNLWAGPSSGGCFIYTASGGIYGPGVAGQTVTEASPTADPKSSPRIAGLVHAEEVCRKYGGCCLRLGGLYTFDRGTHTFYFSAPEAFLKVRGDGLINQIHYDDAAGSCIAAIRQGHDLIAGMVFLLSDGHPMTREDICACALEIPTFRDQYSMPRFTGVDLDGKIYDGSKSNDILHWAPKYTFKEFMASHA